MEFVDGESAGYYVQLSEPSNILSIVLLRVNIDGRHVFDFYLDESDACALKKQYSVASNYVVVTTPLHIFLEDNKNIFSNKYLFDQLSQAHE